MDPLERHLRVPRTARYYVWGKASDSVRDLWIACHGYGQLALPFAKALQPVEASSRLVVVPEALNRFYLDDPATRHGPASPVGAGWMTREDREHEIADYVEYLDTLATAVISEISPRGQPIRVTALGFSQGVATVCRWAALGTTAIQRVILWAGSLPKDLPTDRGAQLFRGASLVVVAGRQDQILPMDVLERDHRTLLDGGLHAELVQFDGGHALNSDMLRRLADVSSGA